MANKRITQLPTAPQVEDNDYIALDNTSTPSAENDGGSRKILAKDVMAKSADAVEYDNTSSGLEADNVQDAIDEVLEEGGKVQDVKVNGVSVLDNNKTAQIVSYKEVTQAQYDALPSSKLTDGIMYCIKDAEFSAEDVPYDNSDSGLESEDVQSAVDEIADVLGALKVEGTVENAQIATFTDGSALPMPKLEVEIEPVQDLHGYDGPWPAGAGKNKLPINSLSISGGGITAIIDRDSNNNVVSVTVNGTASGTVYVILNTFTLPSGTYTMSGCPSNGGTDSYRLYDDKHTSWADNGSGASFTLSEASQVAPTIRIANGYTVNNLKFYPMIESGNTKTTFEPYSNICPISGWSSVNVVRDGINLWDEEWEHKKGYSSGSMLSSNTNIASKNYISCKPSTAYYFKIPSTLQIYVYQYDSIKGFIKANAVNSSEALTTESNTAFLKFASKNDGYSGDYNNDISINYPSTDTSYHAYNPNSETITIQLGDTYYGAKLDVVSGVLTVDRAFVDLGDLTWALAGSSGAARFETNMRSYSPLFPTNPANEGNIISSQYKNYAWNVAISASSTIDGAICAFQVSNNDKRIGIKDSRYSDATSFKTAMNGVQLVYELATPIEIQLTPTQVNSLEGVNNISANSGKINKAVYIRDLNIVINNLLNA